MDFGKKFLIYFILLAGLICFFSCKSHQKIYTPEASVSYLYKPSVTTIHPEYQVYHSRADESRLFFRIMTSELLYNQANPSGQFRASVKIQYFLYNNFNEKIVIDSLSRIIHLEHNEDSDYFVGYLPVKASVGKNYSMLINMTDMLRQQNSTDYIYINKKEPNYKQNYQVIYLNDRSLIFNHDFSGNENFTINFNQSGIQKIFVKYYKKSGLLPPPPAYLDPYDISVPEPDSSWTEDFYPNKSFRLEEKGIYLFSLLEEEPYGLCLTNFGDPFPKPATLQQLIKPLQYITTKDEYRSLINTKELKKGLDKYWLGIGGNNQNARQLIRAYYNRVLFSNLYFSNHNEGWRTDRGMIYTVLGPPNKVIKSELSEKWVYFDSNMKERISYDFYILDHPISGQVYRLQRKEEYEVPWVLSVNKWRKKKSDGKK